MEDGCEVISSWPPEAPEGAASGDDSPKDKSTSQSPITPNSEESTTCSALTPNSEKPTTHSSVAPNSPERVTKRLKRDESESSSGDLRRECLATVGLARWWRREGQQLFRREEDGSLPKSTSTNTLIKFIARCVENNDYKCKDKLFTC